MASGTARSWPSRRRRCAVVEQLQPGRRGRRSRLPGRRRSAPCRGRAPDTQACDSNWNGGTPLKLVAERRTDGLAFGCDPTAPGTRGALIVWSPMAARMRAARPRRASSDAPPERDAGRTRSASAPRTSGPYADAQGVRKLPSANAEARGESTRPRPARLTASAAITDVPCQTSATLGGGRVSGVPAAGWMSQPAVVMAAKNIVDELRYQYTHRLYAGEAARRQVPAR